MKPQTKMLYHYTRMAYLPLILESGRIKKTVSNLLRPRNLQVVCEEPANCPIGIIGYRDFATDWFKPVVWMTDSESPEGLGLPNDKKHVRLSIPMQRHFKKWNKWAKQNNMAPHLMRGLSKGMNWQSWYISEFEIPVDDVVEILNMDTNTVIDWCGKPVC